MITATPESIALAAGLIGQTKGDLAQARRAAGEAFAWLQSIDPSYKPEPVKSPDQSSAADWQAEREEWQLKVSSLIGEREDARRALRNAEGTVAGMQREIDSLRVDLSAARKPVQVAIAAPQPAPQAPIKASPVQAPAAVAADPYAGLPPKMRAFLAAQQGKGLEID